MGKENAAQVTEPQPDETERAKFIVERLLLHAPDSLEYKKNPPVQDLRIIIKLIRKDEDLYGKLGTFEAAGSDGKTVCINVREKRFNIIVNAIELLGYALNPSKGALADMQETEDLVNRIVRLLISEKATSVDEERAKKSLEKFLENAILNPNYDVKVLGYRLLIDLLEGSLQVCVEKTTKGGKEETIYSYKDFGFSPEARERFETIAAEDVIASESRDESPTYVKQVAVRALGLLSDTKGPMLAYAVTHDEDALAESWRMAVNSLLRRAAHDLARHPAEDRKAENMLSRVLRKLHQ